MLRQLALLFVFTISIANAWAAPSAKQKVNGSDSTTQTADRDQRGTPAAPLVVNERSIHSDEETAEEARKEAEQKRFNRWTIYLTLVIAICAFLQFCAIVGQIFVYRGQSQLMAGTMGEIHTQAEQMKIQTNTAQIQTDEITRQVNLMESQGLILKQSADISRGASVPTLRILSFHMGGSDPLVHHEMVVTVRNYGATPAILDALYISFDDGERWPTEEGESISYSEPGGRAVAANSEVVLQSSPYICLVSPALIDRFRRQDRSIYARIRLKYLDVFESPARILRFSVHLNKRQNGTISFQITNQWNEYDNPQNPN